MGSVATKDRAITKLHPFSPWVQQGEISLSKELNMNHPKTKSYKGSKEETSKL